MVARMVYSQVFENIDKIHKVRFLNHRNKDFIYILMDILSEIDCESGSGSIVF